MASGAHVLAYWQHDLEVWVARSWNPLARWLKPKIVISRHPRMPDIYVRLRTIHVSPTLLDCPHQVRQYLLNHELGHLGYLHVVTAYSGLLLWFASLYCQHLSPVRLGLLPWLFLFGGSMFAFLTSWVSFLPPLYEYAADRYAASMIGQENVLKAMLWLVDNRKVKPGNWRLRRLKRQGWPG